MAVALAVQAGHEERRGVGHGREVLDLHGKVGGDEIDRGASPP